MAELEIICVTKKQGDVIERVGLSNGESRTVDAIVYFIDEKEMKFFTKNPQGGDKIQVHTLPHHITKKRHLVTYPDGTTANNLDYLDICDENRYNRIDP